MNYASYTAEDLVLNPEFRAWVINPTMDSNEFWENWLRQYPEKIQEVKKAKKILKNFPLEYNHLKDEVVDDLWKAIESAARKDQSKEAGNHTYLLNSETIISRFENQRYNRKISFRTKSRKIAAGIILVIGATLGYTTLSLQNQEERISEKKVVMITKENPRGQKSTIYLHDGSKITLNANSKLTFPEQFSHSARVVHLEGEAFFEVAEDSNSPFQVNTGNVTTTALGTSFNINTKNNRIHVALVTGKVYVSNIAGMQESNLLLNPGEDAFYNEAINALVKGQFDNKEVLAWKNKIIVFKRAGEDYVMGVLEDWYDVDITTTNKSSLTWDYSGEFKKMTLHDVLVSMGFTMKFDFEINDQQVTITYH